MSASFAPFTSGETVVQNYNALHSLSILQQTADFIGYFPNDSLLSTVNRTMAGASHVQNDKLDKIGMQELNAYAANCLAGIILPQTKVSRDGSVGK